MWLTKTDLSFLVHQGCSTRLAILWCSCVVALHGGKRFLDTGEGLLSPESCPSLPQIKLRLLPIPDPVSSVFLCSHRGELRTLSSALHHDRPSKTQLDISLTQALTRRTGSFKTRKRHIYIFHLKCEMKSFKIKHTHKISKNTSFCCINERHECRLWVELRTWMMEVWHFPNTCRSLHNIVMFPRASAFCDCLESVLISGYVKK